MTGDSDKWTFEAPRHVFDEPRFSTTGRAFKNYGKPRGVGGFEQFDFTTDWKVVGLVCDAIFLGYGFRHLKVSRAASEP